MDPIVRAAGTAVVNVMTVDAWQRTRAVIVDWWREVRPAQAETVDLALVQGQDRLLTALGEQDPDVELDLVNEWRFRLQSLVGDDPQLVRQLRRLLDEELVPALSGQEGRAALS